MPDIDLHVSSSHRVRFDDLDWDAARAAGLTAEERAYLQFFVDIEGQTLFYMLEVAKLKAAQQPDLLTFLTLWTYEEFFHSHALSELLKVCGGNGATAMERATRVRAQVRLRAVLEDGVQMAMARAVPQSFVALWMTWGATQEFLTLQAYESIVQSTRNPVLAELARRIAKQERRHFAFYHASARERLSGDPFAQRFVRFVLDRNWNPLGSGVKTPAEHAAMVANILPGPRLMDVLARIDAKMATLPGLEGLDCCRAWGRGIQPLLPEWARA